MNRVRSSVWNKGWISLAAIIACMVLLFIQQRIETNRKARVSVEQAAAVCRDLNQMVYGDQHPFAPSDITERRRSIVKKLAAGFVELVAQWEPELKAALRDAKRLNVDPWDLADIAHAAGDLPLAEKAARKVVAGEGRNSPISHVILGDILNSAKKYPEAEAEYQKALELAGNGRAPRWFAPAQRLARLYSDEQTYVPSLDASGHKIPKQAEIIRRKQLSLSFWQTLIDDREKSANERGWMEDFWLANTRIHFAHVLRDCGRYKEARYHYARALQFYRSDDGSGEGEDTQKIRQYIDSVPPGDGDEGKQ